MFAPVGDELAQGLRLFTGERITSWAGATHILGEDACRVLYRLGVRHAAVRRALDQASEGVVNRLDDLWDADKRSDEPWHQPGYFCCGKCSVALWRHLAARRDGYAESKLAVGIDLLRKRRTGDGTWTGFPFHYTLLALVETDLPEARTELDYARPACQAHLGKRTQKNNPYSQRRRRITELALAKR